MEVDPENRIGRRNSEGGKAYVATVSPTISVRYVISGLLSQSVVKERIHVAKIGTSGRRRGIDGGRTPSILDNSYPEYQRQQQLIADSLFLPPLNQNEPVRRNSIVNCRLVTTRYLLSLFLKKGGKEVLEVIEKMNKTNEEGWLRKAENVNKQKETPKNTHLLEKEKELVVKLTMCLKMFQCQRATSKVRYAWGVSRCTIQRIIKKEVLENGDFKRKERNDKGLTLFNSERKRQSTITPYSVFKKAKRIENNGRRLTNDQVYSAWRSLSDDELHRYGELSVEHKERCGMLLVEIGTVLRRTRGRLTW